MKLLLISTAVLLIVAGDCLAQESKCPLADARAAEASLDRLESWSDLHRAFKRFAACDYGTIAEGWDDVVARTLAHGWRQFGELQRIVAKDRKFRAFVLRHISQTAADEDLNRALLNAHERCPRNGEALCAEIADAIASLGAR